VVKDQIESTRVDRSRAEAQASRRRKLRRGLALLVGAFGLVALLAAGGAFDIVTPRPCVELFSADRCSAFADAAAAQFGANPDDIVAVEIVPTPRPEGLFGEQAVRSLSGPGIEIQVTRTDGSRPRLKMCVGVSMEPACQAQPHLRAQSPITGGYRDIPCDGEPPAGCATPVPPPDPAVLAGAVALEVDRLDIPIDRRGSYSIVVGEARLPNGILSEASFGFADPWPAGVSIASGVVSLDVTSLEPDGLPFRNVYEHGWREGLERVEVTVRFEVIRFEPGAVLSLTDLIVR